MVTVIFNKGDTQKGIIGKLDQYDYGQILRIQGLSLPPVVEVHFAMRERGGDSVSRIGITKDGVTDVPIPDSMLENNNTPQDYSIYAFVYITDATSGKTEYRIALSVRARPKPEIPGGGDNPDIFHEAVQAVREAAEQAAESEKQAEGWAHGREDLPERAEDNARYYAGQAQEDSRKTAEDRKEVERLVESVSGIDEQVAKVEELSKNAQEAATRAETSAEQGEIHKQAAENASTAAQAAAGKTAEDRAAVQKAKEAVEELSTQVQENKDSVDKTAQDFTLTAQQALADVNNAGQTQTDRVQTAGETAVRDIQTAQRTATGAVETAKTEAVKTIQAEGATQTGKVTAEGEKQVQAVQAAAQEIIADREQIHANKEGLAKLKEELFANGSAEVPIDLTWNDGFYYGEGQKMSFGNYCHAKFTVSPGETIRISGQEGVGSTNVAVTFATFDENGKWVGNNIATGSIEYTIPKGVKSIALNHNNINFTVNVSVFKIKNKTRMDVLQEEIDNNYQELSKLPLNGKVVYVLGDSITYLNGSWVNKLSEKTGAKKVINCGRGGATWRWRDSYIPYFGSDIYSKNIVANVSADGKTVNFDGNTNLSNGNLPTDNNNYTYINNEIAFMQRLINEDYEKPNVIIIACGINDTGASCEVYSDELFESKFYTDRDSLSNTVKKTLGGGLRANIEALKALYPTATIIVSTPIQSPYKYFRPYIPNTCTWIKKFAEFYSCPVIDAYSESGISAFFEKGWDDMSYNGDNAGRYLFDGLHPNVDGYKLLSNYFSNRINTIYVSNV